MSTAVQSADQQNSNFSSPQHHDESHQPRTNFLSNYKLVSGIFIASVPLVWIVLLIRDWQSGLAFPIVFVPTIAFLGIWKYYRNSSTADLPITLLGYVYAQGFWIVGMIVLLWRIFCTLFALGILTFILAENASVGSVASVYVLYALFGEAAASEYGKYRITIKGRSDRPEFDKVSTYLWYACSGALGFSTICVVISVYFYSFRSVKVQLIYLAIVILLELPLHLATGYIIGVGVAKNECFKWNLNFFQICWIPLLLRGIASSFFILVGLYPEYVAFIVYAICFVIALVVIYFQNKQLPNSFSPLPNEPTELV
jgi:hypothetical protein